jgi:hypothetical protein
MILIRKQILLNRNVTFDESEIGCKHLDEEIPLLEEKKLMGESIDYTYEIFLPKLFLMNHHNWNYGWIYNMA